MTFRKDAEETADFSILAVPLPQKGKGSAAHSAFFPPESVSSTACGLFEKNAVFTAKDKRRNPV